MPEIPRSYVVIRTDLAIAVQMVQTAHACLQAGDRFAQPAYSHLVFLCVDDEQRLLDLSHDLDTWGVQYALFYEPDGGVGFSALCTAPLEGAMRKPFARFKLWAPNASRERRPATR